jgi:AcrR family transcriptional regulator
MDVGTRRPTRREERRAQTVREIKTLAMEQVRDGGPDAVSLSGIVREMAMSPAAVYRYFENRDALLADLVVDAYVDFADFLETLASSGSTADETLDAVLDGARTWALAHPNAYRLIFQTSIGSGQHLAPERTVPAATRSMAVVVAALAAADAGPPQEPATSGATAEQPPTDALDDMIAAWGERSGLTGPSPLVLRLALTSWTRLHGIISLELGGHLAAVGVDPGALYAAEVVGVRQALAACSGTSVS